MPDAPQPPSDLPGPTPDIAVYTISCEHCGAMFLEAVRFGYVTQVTCYRCHKKATATLEMSMHVKTGERKIGVRFDKSP